MKKELIVKISLGVATIAGLAITTSLLLNEKDDVENVQEPITSEQNIEQIDVEEKTDGEHSDVVIEEENVDKPNENNTNSSMQEDDSHDTHDDHNHSSPTAAEYKSEDIISDYFAAITLGNAKALNQLFPSGQVENEGLVQLVQNSTIVADIVDMQKLSINNNTAEYTVTVKLYTKDTDENFTNNKTTYKLVLDLTSNTITSKTTVNTEYLE